MKKQDFELHHVPHVRTGLGWGVLYAALCVWELEMMSFIEAQRGAESEQSE